MQEHAVETLLAKQDIYELSCRYMRALDRLDVDLMKSVFFDDAWCEYGFIDCPAPEFADFCMRALGGHVANHHMIGNVLVEVEGDEAFGEVYFHAYHKVPAASGEGFEDLVIAGRYLDRYERRDGTWKIAYRSERNDWSRTATTNDPYFDLMSKGLRGSRQDDAVYDKTNRRRLG
jgi:hypothetical protein